MSEKIVFYKDQWPVLNALTDEEAGRLLKAAFTHSLELIPDEEIAVAFGFGEDQADRALRMAWGQCLTKLIYNEKESARRSKQNADAANIRWEKEKAQKADANASERMQMHANASESMQAHAHAPTYTKTGRKTRRDADGYLRYADTGELVSEGGTK